MDSSLVETCQLFLVPIAIFFGALGIAQREPLKAGVSFMGLLTSVLWLIRVREFDVADPLRSPPPEIAVSLMDYRIAWILAGAFVVAWIISLGVHGWLCCREYWLR